jgi:hypothetical protein
MKIYLVCLLLVTGAIGMIAPTAVSIAQPQPASKIKAVTTTAKIISPAAALKRVGSLPNFSRQSIKIPMLMQSKSNEISV